MIDLAGFAGRAMGSPLRLQVTPGAGPGPAPDLLWSAVRAEFAATESELTCYRPESALSRLNATAGTGQWWPATPRLFGFLAMAQRAGRLTRGRFNPTVLGDLIRLGQPGLTAPDKPSWPAGRPTAGSRWLETDGRARRVRLGTPVDSGGLGKGLALRWAWHSLDADLAGRGALLEAGGDIVGQAAPGAEPWQVGIEDPTGGPDPLAVIALIDGAICTSSIARQRWVDPAGQPAHHLIDPQTGEPAQADLLAVTVAAADPAWAEVWTKALFLAGSGAIGDEARARGLAAWWVEADGTLRMTPAARQRTTWCPSWS